MLRQYQSLGPTREKANDTKEGEQELNSKL